MPVYRVAVYYSTHEGLKNGELEGLQFCAVEANNGTEAELIAAQIVGCLLVPEGTSTRKNPNPLAEVMVTQTRIIRD